MWHTTMVNILWKNKIKHNGKHDCPFCGHSIDELKCHQFWESPKFQDVHGNGLSQLFTHLICNLQRKVQGFLLHGSSAIMVKRSSLS